MAALAALRFVWVWTSMKIRFSGAKPGDAGPPRSSYARLVMAMSLAGVRGAVTLAGVLTLPVRMADGSPFPGRDLAIFLAAGVIVLSLVLPSAALPRVLRGLELPPDPAHRAAENRVRTAATEAALRAINMAGKARKGLRADAGLYAEVSKRIARSYRQRLDRYTDDDGASTLGGKTERIERELRLVGLRAERDEVLKVGPVEGIQEEALRKLVREIDLQEARHSS